MVVRYWDMDRRLPAPDSLLCAIAPLCHRGYARARWQADWGEKEDVSIHI